MTTAHDARVAQCHARSARGSLGPGRSGRPGGRRATVGSTAIPGLTTTIGDRERVLRQLHTEFAQLEEDFAAKMTTRDARDPLWQWWQIAGVPTLAEWHAFYADQIDSWWSKFSTDWDVYTDWQERLVRLREASAGKLKQAGKHLETPDPVNLPKVPWKGLGEDARHAVDETAKILKYAGYAAIGVAGLLVVSNVVSTTSRARR